jgi:hypothetical protein
LEKSALKIFGGKPSDVISGKSLTRILKTGSFFSPCDIYRTENDCPVLLHCPFGGRAFNVFRKGVAFLRESLPSETDNSTWRNSRSGAQYLGSICLPCCASQSRRKQHYAVKDGTLHWFSAIVHRQMPSQAQACKGSDSVLESSQHPALLMLAVFKSVLNAYFSANA